MVFRPLNEEQIRFAAKAALRERLKRIRRALPRDAAKLRDERIHTRCLELIDGGVIASYIPMGAEISTQLLHQALQERGMQIALPTLGAAPDTPIVWRRYDPETELVRHPLGFDMPSERTEQVEPNSIRWVLTPCLAVDETGHRLGWGGGYYDRALAALPSATSIAIAYDFQLMAELPSTPGDQRVDWVVTDARSFQSLEPPHM